MHTAWWRVQSSSDWPWRCAASDLIPIARLEARSIWLIPIAPQASKASSLFIALLLLSTLPAASDEASDCGMKRRRQDPNHRLVLVCSCVWLLVASSSVGAFTTAFGRKPVRAHRRHPSTACLSAATAPSDGGTLCIKFSRCYQRFVAYRPRRGRPGRREANADAIFKSKSDHNNATTNRRLFCRFDDECREVVQSFLYLDEALELYPSARLVKLQEVSDREDDADYNQIVPGMGNRPSSSVSRIILDPNNRDVGLVMEDDEDGIEEYTSSNAGSLQTKKENIHHNITREGLEALEYLTSLTVSLVASQSRDKGDDMDTLRQNIASTLRERIGMKRFMEHSPQSLQQNYHRLMDLFTRSRAWNADGGGRTDEIIGPGLALRESEARNIISYFPELCLYDYNEVEERIDFFLSPLPPENVVGSLSDAPTSKRKRRGRRPFNSTSNAGGKEVDCEFFLFVSPFIQRSIGHENSLDLRITNCMIALNICLSNSFALLSSSITSHQGQDFLGRDLEQVSRSNRQLRRYEQFQIYSPYAMPIRINQT